MKIKLILSGILLALIIGTGSQPISYPRHHSTGVRVKASRKFSVLSDTSMVR